MITASFSEVIKVILIILLIYFGIKILFRWFGPMLLKYFLKKIGKHVEKKFRGFDTSRDQQKKRKEGDVTIEKKPKNKRKSNKDVGDYIDYEEID